MDEPTRRAWTRPELVVLVRSGPEEAVLTPCKASGTRGAIPSSFDHECQNEGECVMCSVDTPS